MNINGICEMRGVRGDEMQRMALMAWTLIFMKLLAGARGVCGLPALPKDALQLEAGNWALIFRRVEQPRNVAAAFKEYLKKHKTMPHWSEILLCLPIYERLNALGHYPASEKPGPKRGTGPQPVYF